MVGVDFSPRNEPAPMRHVVTPEHDLTPLTPNFSWAVVVRKLLPDIPPINTQLQLGGRSSGTLPNRFQRFSRCLASMLVSRTIPSKCLILRHAISAFAFSSSAQPRQVRLPTLAKFLLSKINKQI